MNIKNLVKLTSKAWTVSILAQIGAGVPGRQAALRKATGAGRTAFGQSLSHLLDMELLEKTPGHGHPLRPEYQLTAQGNTLTEPAIAIDTLLHDTPEAGLTRRMWVLPLLGCTQSPQAFTALAKALPPITDRALSQALNRLQNAGWIHRDVDIAARPPRATYCAIGTGALIATQVQTMLGNTEGRPQCPHSAKGAGRLNSRPTLG